MAADEQRRWSDERLDDRFGSLERELNALHELSGIVRDNTSAMRGLTAEQAATKESVVALREDNRSLGRTLTGFFVSLLLTLVAAIVGVVILL